MSSSELFRSRQRNVLQVLNRYLATANLSRSQQEEIAFKKLILLLEHATTNTWWAKRAIGWESARSFRELLDRLPILTRKEIQDNWDAMQVEIPGSREEQFVIHSTSGSTGKPVLVRKYLPSSAKHNMAAQLVTHRWHKIDVSLPTMQVRWNGNEFYVPHAGQPMIYLGKTGPYRGIHLEKITLSETVELMKTEKTGIALANPTAIELLLAEMERTGNSLPDLKFILSYAERVTPEMRELAEIATNAKLIDRFSTEELGTIALQCPYSEHLHILNTHNYVEIVDENGLSVPDGESGRVIVTNFHSLGMPLIRYELGDIASLGSACEHGINYPVLEPGIVRIKERLIDSRGEPFTPSGSGAKGLKEAKLSDFQLYRFDDSIVLVYEADKPLSEESEAKITNDLQTRFRTEQKVIPVYQSDLSWAGYWKRKDFIRVDKNWPGQFNLDDFKKYS